MNKEQLKIFWTWYYVAERKGGNKLSKDLHEAFDNQWDLFWEKFWEKESHIRKQGFGPGNNPGFGRFTSLRGGCTPIRIPIHIHDNKGEDDE